MAALGSEGRGECARCRAGDGVSERWIDHAGDRVPCPRCRPFAFAQWFGHGSSTADDAGPARPGVDFARFAELLQRAGAMTPERWLAENRHRAVDPGQGVDQRNAGAATAAGQPGKPAGTTGSPSPQGGPL